MMISEKKIHLLLYAFCLGYFLLKTALVSGQFLYPIHTGYHEWSAIDSHGNEIIHHLSAANLYVVGNHSEFAIATDNAPNHFEVSFYNHKGKVVWTKKDTEIEWIGQGILKYSAQRNSKTYYGLIDTSGKLITKADYLSIGNFQDGLIKALYLPDPAMDEVFATIGYLNREGIFKQETKNQEYSLPGDKYKRRLYSNDFGEVWGIEDSAGRILTEPLYTTVNACWNGFMVIKFPNRRVGLLDQNGESLISGDSILEINYAPENEHDTLVVLKIRRILKYFGGCIVHPTIDIYKICNLHGNPLPSARFCEISAEKFGVFQITNDSGFYGLMDAKSQIILSPDYKFIDFRGSEPFLAENKALKWGYLNHLGKPVIPFVYDDAKPFENGLAFVSTGYYEEILQGVRGENFHGVLSYIDTTGKAIWSFRTK